MIVLRFHVQEIICTKENVSKMNQPQQHLLDRLIQAWYDSPTNTDECTVCGKTLHISELSGVADDQGAYICDKCMHAAYVAEREAANVV